MVGGYALVDALAAQQFSTQRVSLPKRYDHVYILLVTVSSLIFH